MINKDIKADNLQLNELCELLESRPNFHYFNDGEKFSKACIFNLEDFKQRFDKIGFMNIKALLKDGILEVKRDKEGNIP